MASPQIFPLAFGSRKAVTFQNGRDYADFAATKISTLEAIDPLGSQPNKFAASLCPITIGSVSGLASSTTPMLFEDRGADGFYIEIALTGAQTGTVGKTKLSWGKGENIAFFAPEGKIHARSGLRSHAIFRLEPQKIADTAGVMSSSAGTKVDIGDLNRSRIIPATIGKTNFLKIYDRIFRLIDDCDVNSELASSLPLEDMIYRTFLLSVFPQIAGIDPCQGGEDKISLICEYIKANPHKWVSATVMEQLSGLSSRSIQIAFQKKYGMSPMQWQRTEKLHEARKILITAPSLKIEEVSTTLAFPSVSAFSSYYKHLFGELPRQTRKRTRG